MASFVSSNIIHYFNYCTISSASSPMGCWGYTISTSSVGEGTYVMMSIQEETAVMIGHTTENLELTIVIACITMATLKWKMP
jgi:hypothetical protein